MPATDLDESVGDVPWKMSNLSYQGVMLGSAVDASGMTSLHIDSWSAARAWCSCSSSHRAPLRRRCARGERRVWNSFEIDLSAYADGGVDLSDVIQMKFNSPAEGGLKEFYIDNLMFTDNAPDYAVPAYPQTRRPRRLW